MPHYCLYFTGECHEEFTLDTVKSNFKNHFDLTEAQIEEYFSGNEIILDSNLNQLEALNRVVEIEELGGICYFLPLEDELSLPEGIITDRRKEQRRKRSRRASYRAGIHSDRRHSRDRRKAERN